MGARPLRRAIQSFIENPVSEKIIASDIKPGDLIIADSDGKEISFEIKRITKSKLNV